MTTTTRTAQGPTLPTEASATTRLVTGRQVAVAVGRRPHDGVVSAEDATTEASAEDDRTTQAAAEDDPTTQAAAEDDATTQASAAGAHGRAQDGRRDGHDGERGMATAEYAIATVAAAGFAGLLVVILRSGEVRELLFSIIRSALSL
jgi:hypothetical protein